MLLGQLFYICNFLNNSIFYFFPAGRQLVDRGVRAGRAGPRSYDDNENNINNNNSNNNTHNDNTIIINNK